MSNQKPFRLYLDTSVFGGCFDGGFSEDSNRVISYIRSGLMHLVYSETLETELEGAPAKVKDLLTSLPKEVCMRVLYSEEVESLEQAYLDAKIVGTKWREDCIHVATATVARADAIVSWNFKHIVQLDKIKAYNSINFLKGYGMLTIVSPKDINLYETDKNRQV